MALSKLTKTGEGSTSSFKAEGALVDRELYSRFSDVLNVVDYGAVGVGDDTLIIQSVIELGAKLKKKVISTAPVHTISGDLLIKRSGDNDYVFEIDFGGARFEGNGVIKIYGTKSIILKNLVAYDMSLDLSGFYLGLLHRVYTNELILSGNNTDDPLTPTGFKSNAWSEFSRCRFGTIKFLQGRSFCNQLTFNTCEIRSASGQGMRHTHDYNIEIEDINHGIQAVVFNNCDLSYATKGVIKSQKFPYTSEEEGLTFNECYFDSWYPSPQPDFGALNVWTTNCINVNPVGVVDNIMASKDCLDSISGDKTSSSSVIGTINLIDNGNLLADKPIGGGVIVSGGGFHNRHLVITNDAYFGGSEITMEGYYNHKIILESNNGNAQRVQIAFGNNFVNINIPATGIVTHTLCSRRPWLHTDKFTLGSLRKINNEPINLKVHYIAVTYGKTSPSVAIPNYVISSYSIPTISTITKDFSNIPATKTGLFGISISGSDRRAYEVTLFCQDSAYREGLINYNGILHVYSDLNGSPSVVMTEIYNIQSGNLSGQPSMVVSADIVNGEALLSITPPVGVLQAVSVEVKGDTNSLSDLTFRSI